MRKKLSQFAAAFVLSAIIHLAFVARLSGLDLLQFAPFSPDRVIHVDLSSGHRDSLVPDKSPPPSLRKPEREGPSPDTAGDDLRKNEGNVTQVSREAKIAEPTDRANERDESPSIADNTPSETNREDEAAKTEGPSEPARPAAGEEAKSSKAPPLLTALREKLQFDISWAGIHVGQAVLEAANENGDILITSRVHSAAAIALFYKVEDFSESRIVNGQPSDFRIRQREGKYRSDKDTVFDQANGKITFFNYLSNKMEEHTTEGRLPWDVMSGFYYLRTRPLTVGETVYIDVFDSGKFLKAEVSVLKKEKIAVRGAGEVDTVKLQLVLKSDGLFQSKGNITIWLTDDDRRIPVRVETKAPVGSVTAELTSMERES